jgi:hypothetical protein
MARNASGIYSLPSAVNPVVTRTVITTDWANTTLTDIKTEITNSLDRTGRGAMTAPLQINAGTAALPGLTIDGDTNSGMYGAAADSLGFSTGGTLRLTIASALLTAAVPVGAADGAVGAPGLTFSADLDCGLYRAGANDVRLAIGGALRAQFDTKTSLAAATAATGGTRQDALSLTNGDIDLSGVTAPTSTTAINTRITPSNIIKAWGVVTTDGAATYNISVTQGFNIGSVSRIDADTFRVTFAQAFANANYGAVAYFLNGNDIAVNVDNGGVGRTASYCEFTIRVASTNGATSLDGTATTVNFFVLFLGAQ